MNIELVKKNVANFIYYTEYIKILKIEQYIDSYISFKNLQKQLINELTNTFKNNISRKFNKYDYKNWNKSMLEKMLKVTLCYSEDFSKLHSSIGELLAECVVLILDSNFHTYEELRYINKLFKTDFNDLTQIEEYKYMLHHKFNIQDISNESLKIMHSKLQGLLFK
jgi:hypothetical protein